MSRIQYLSKKNGRKSEEASMRQRERASKKWLQNHTNQRTGRGDPMDEDAFTKGKSSGKGSEGHSSKFDGTCKKGHRESDC